MCLLDNTDLHGNITFILQLDSYPLIYTLGAQSTATVVFDDNDDGEILQWNTFILVTVIADALAADFFMKHVLGLFQLKHGHAYIVGGSLSSVAGSAPCKKTCPLLFELHPPSHEPCN